MAFNINDKSSSVQRELIQEGLYPARLARIIEIGKQETPYGVRDQAILGFTMPTLKVSTGDGKSYQQMFYTFGLNLTSNPDSTIVKYVKALGGEDWNSVIGNPCMLEIAHKERQADKTKYATISNVTRPLVGLEVEAPDCDVFIFDFQNPDKSVFDKLEEWQQERIKSALNYEGSKLQELLEGKTKAKEYAEEAQKDAAYEAAVGLGQDFDDDIPF